MKKMKRYVLGMVGCALILGAIPAVAQQGLDTVGRVVDQYSFRVEPFTLTDYLTDWNVWVFDGTDKVTFIGDDDRQSTFTLPVQGESGTIETVGAGDTGLQLYYIAVDAARRRVSVHAYAVPSGQVDVVVVEMPEATTLGRTFVDFSASGTRLAFALTYEDTDPEFNYWNWEFFLWQLPDRIVAALNADSPQVRVRLELNPRHYALVNFYMSEVQIEFGLMQYGTNPAAGAASLMWDPLKSWVGFAGTAGWPGVPLEANGMQAYVVFSEAYPACWTGDVEPRPNIVEVFNPNARPDRVVIYNEMLTYVANEMTWIDDGLRLAFAVPDDEYTVMRILSRDRLGLVEELFTLPYASWLAGAFTMHGLPDGLLVAARTGDTMEIQHRPGAAPGSPRSIWSGPAAARIVWTTPLSPPNGLPPFLEMREVRLVAGVRARVNSTEGDPVALRVGPGTSNPWETVLDEGAVVEVVGGPAQADGLTWWEVRTGAGQVGWVAEMLRDAYCIRLLVPMAE